ncbi:TapB family protein [Zavarzinella formosa]|uniref:TapB family protein n=1 Tax=Zavarzinella formosa TaxID=360055 RepID=UPI0002E7EA7A|nr:hypothetical protein [Zavarzinella formosa]
MRFAVLALLTLCLPIFAQPKDKPTYYYTTKVGDTVVREVTANGKTTDKSSTVDSVEEKDGVLTVVVKPTGKPGAPAIETMLVSKTELTLPPQGPIDVPITFLKLPAKKGDTWESMKTSKGAGGVIFKSACMGEEEVEVPAGKFKAIKVETAVMTPTEEYSRMTMWHAPGVGLVKLMTKSGGRETSSVLKSFTPGK